MVAGKEIRKQLRIDVVQIKYRYQCKVKNPIPELDEKGKLVF